eukprot:364410-Chlamydomonas_euryale.AAC.10
MRLSRIFALCELAIRNAGIPLSRSLCRTGIARTPCSEGPPVLRSAQDRDPCPRHVVGAVGWVAAHAAARHWPLQQQRHRAVRLIGQLQAHTCRPIPAGPHMQAHTCRSIPAGPYSASSRPPFRHLDHSLVDVRHVVTLGGDARADGQRPSHRRRAALPAS